MTEETPFDRIICLFSKEKVEALFSKTVMIAGLGGVGAMAAEALARTGVGHLILVDFDTVSVSNLNRQIIATHSVLGQKKAVVLENRLKDINPNLSLTRKEIFISKENIDELLLLNPDYVVDAIDSFSSKIALIETLLDKEIPFISSMGAAQKTDILQIKLDKMKKSSVCKLAHKVRQTLRKEGYGLDFPCVYSTELPFQNSEQRADKKQIFLEEKEDLLKEKYTTLRMPLGSFMPVTGTFGLLIAQYVLLNLIKEKGEKE
ncbi:MAG: tRNA threonylcarbamoyladenosine dehydratase [Alphaproteobacteria bacterium]|nr:tRNA threonylcarbamoyladenosine dehydratase [Alphaproteobacteria bacterium]